MECRLWRLFRCAPHVEMRVPCAQIRCNAIVVEQRCCCCQEEEAAQGEQLLIGAGGVGDWRRRSGFRHWNFRRLKLLQTMYRELIIVRLTAFYLRMALRSHPQTCSSSDTAFSFFFSRRTRNQHGTANAILTTTSASKGWYPRDWHSQPEPYPRLQSESAGRRSCPRWSGFS
jgi:hypothetical protein